MMQDSRGGNKEEGEREQGEAENSIFQIVNDIV